MFGLFNSKKYKDLNAAMAAYQNGEMTKEQFVHFQKIVVAMQTMDQIPMNQAVAQAGDACMQFGYDQGFPVESHVDEYQYKTIEELAHRIKEFDALDKLYTTIIGNAVELVKNVDQHLIVTRHEIRNRREAAKYCIDNDLFEI